MKLAVDITTYLCARSDNPHPTNPPISHSAITYRDGRVDRDDIPLLDKQLPRLVAELADLGFRYRAACSQLGDRPIAKK